MLARAPAGTKRWKLWATYEELQAKELQGRRRALVARADHQRGVSAASSSTWLVGRGGNY